MVFIPKAYSAPRMQSRKILLLVAILGMTFVFVSGFSVNLSPEENLQSIEEILRMKGIFDESEDPLNKLSVEQRQLWKHTKFLMRAPTDLQELKACLQKSFIFNGIGKAAITLGEYNLFEFPIIQSSIQQQQQQQLLNSFEAPKAQYKNKQQIMRGPSTLKNPKYCRDFQTKNATKLAEFDSLQRHDSIDSTIFTRDFSKALIYFNAANKLEEPEAPLLLMFMLQMNLYTESTMSSSVKLDFGQTQKLLGNLFQIAQIRGSKFASPFILNELMHCLHLEANPDTVLFDRIEDAMVGRLQKAIGYSNSTNLNSNATLSEVTEGNDATTSEGSEGEKEVEEKASEGVSNRFGDLEADYQMLKKLVEYAGYQHNIKGLEFVFNQKVKVKQFVSGSEEGFDEDEEVEEEEENLSDFTAEMVEWITERLSRNINNEQFRKEKKQTALQFLKKFEMVLHYSDHFLLQQRDGSCPNCNEALAVAVQAASQELNADFEDDDEYDDEEEQDEIDSIENDSNQVNGNENVESGNSNQEQVENTGQDSGIISIFNRLRRGVGRIFGGGFGGGNVPGNNDNLPGVGGAQPAANAGQVEEILRMRAENGDIAAQLQLGNDYYQGNFANQIQRNPAGAAALYEQAANLGNPQAMFNTGLMYANGQGVAQNGTIAKHYFDSAIEAGEQIGYAGLGFLYNQGIGVEKNLTMAAQSFQKAANAGNKDAMVNFAILTYSGYDNVPANKTYAIDLMLTIIETSKRAQIFVGIEKMNNPKLNVSCHKILEYLTKKDLLSSKLDAYSEKSLLKQEEGDEDSALVYSLFAAFLGHKEGFEQSAKLWKQRSKQYNSPYVISYRKAREATEMHREQIACAMGDNKLCALLFYHRDALLHRNSSFIQVAHILYEGSRSFEANVKHASNFYEATTYLPESLHSISFIHEKGHLGEINITKAIEVNDLIFKKALAGEFSIENALPAILRKIYLFFLSFIY